MENYLMYSAKLSNFYFHLDSLQILQKKVSLLQYTVEFDKNASNSIQNHDTNRVKNVNLHN